MTIKSELWWVSVGGNECEPARIVTNGSVEECFTIGCNDGTILFEGCGIEKVSLMSTAPNTPLKQKENNKLWEIQREKDRKRGITHSYRKFS